MPHRKHGGPRIVLLRGGVGVAVLALLAGGCAQDVATAPGLYASEFKQAREAATTDLERDILADDQITDAEYQEVRERLKSCVAGRGFELELLADGGTSIPYSQGDEAALDTAIQECEANTVVNIESLYWDMRKNPEKVDLDEASAECLRKAGLVGAEFDGKEFDETFSNPQYDTGDPRVSKCINDPLAQLSK
ncbi:hypothetical protein GCM10010488_27150 [Oerskovia jenensis]